MDLLEFLTSKEIIIVYIVAGVACLLCFIIYLVDRNNVKARLRHNTRELNKLVEQVKDEIDEEVVDEPIVYDEPVLEVIETPEEVTTVPIVAPERVETTPIVEEKVETPKVEEELQYTTIEPDQKTAQLELKKLEEELRRQQEEEIQEQEEVSNNISLTNYEEEQEENAIISLEELVKKSKDMYEANELTQYADEGNEPITLQELEAKVGKESTKIEDTFIIENVVSEEELNTPVLEEEPVLQQVTLDDFNTVKVEDIKQNTEEIKRFKSSPIISPIYGIEKEVSDNDMELENTADYEKLDQEIKKTNEFLMTLRELQSKLD